MATADRIERERLAKRTRILDAARELFVERGFEAVTLREIAQRIEYSTTAIYVQFKDKQDLVDHMVREDFRAFVEALAVAATVPEPFARLTRLGDAYVEFALTLPRHYQLLFMTPAKHAVDKHKRHEAPPGIEGYQLLLQTVMECIATKQLRADFDDPHIVAQAIWSCVHGLVSLLIVMGDHEQFHWRASAELVQVALGSLVRGMLADPLAADAHRPAPKTKKPPKAKRRRPTG